MSRTEIRHAPSAPNQLDRNEIHIQHSPDSADVEGIWAGSKVDVAKCMVPMKVVHNADGVSYQLLPETKYAGMDTSTGVATATLPAAADIQDGHVAIIADEGSNAGTNNITVATPDDATVGGAASGSITTNDAVTKWMYDRANDNWVNVS